VHERALARLAVRFGANVEPGQDVFVFALDVGQAPLAREVAAAAYEAGARVVSVLYWDQHVKLARLEHASEDSLSVVPDWWERFVRECIERRGAQIVLWGDPEPDLLRAVDPERLAKDPMPYTPSLSDLTRELEVNWTVVPGPTPAIAERLLGDPSVERLWELLTPILRLDADDPVTAWHERAAVLDERARALNDRDFAALHFRGPGTDLRVPLIGRARWRSAATRTNWGRDFFCNLPSEEVYTSPDYRGVEGTVAITRPVALRNGVVADGLRLRFENGRVVEVDADAHVDAVRSLIAADEGAPRLGEVALVDGSSPVARSGLVFGDLLLDENATCHVALGSAYPVTVADLPDEPSERDALGFNSSNLHQDVMIGGPEVSVEGVDRAGRPTPILEQEVWVLPG
jgi:aminopeptidase